MFRVHSCASFLAVLTFTLLAGCDSSSGGGDGESQGAAVAQTPAPTQATSLTSEPPQSEVATTFASVPEAITVMKSCATDSDTSQLRAVGEWLAQQGQPAIAPLVAVINDTSLGASARLAACRILGDMGPVARDALHSAVESDQYNVRLKAIESLGALKPAQPETVQVIMTQLDDEDEMIVRISIAALGRIGEPAAVAAEQLQLMQNDNSLSDSIRDSAHDTLRKIDPRRDFTGLDESENG